MSNAFTAALIVAALYVYITAGRSLFTRLDQHDRLVHPDMADDCEFRAGLAAEYPGAIFTRWTFIALWPAFMALGWVNAAVQRLRGQ